MIGSGGRSETMIEDLTLPCPGHPGLRTGCFITILPRPLAEVPSPEWLLALHRAEAPAPFARDEEVRQAVRDVLRFGGYKPTGRGKPSSEYLIRAAQEGALPPINLAVDACNAVSLHTGLPISVVDADKAREPWSIALAAEGARYVFNSSGQEIDLAGLPCLCDADGPCANAVKDAQRTKTGPATRRTLSVVWAPAGRGGLLSRAVAWYQEILRKACA